MIGAAGALALAIVIAAAIINRAKRNPAPQGRPGLLSWSAFWFSVVGALAFGLAITVSAAMAGTNVTPLFNRAFNPFVVSIALIFAGAILAVAAIVRQDRKWPTWVAFALGGIGVAFWVAFGIGEIAYPH